MWKTPVDIPSTTTSLLCMIRNKSKWNIWWKQNLTSSEEKMTAHRGPGITRKQLG